MSIIRLTKEFAFETAHALDGYDGACSQIHGHSYRLFVTVKGTPACGEGDPKLGMVMDFGDLKKIVNRLITDRYDHTLVMRRTDANTPVIEALRKKFDRVITTSYQPTCENMLVDFASMISAELPRGVKLHSLKMHETATSFAEWYADDNA